ncbi:MAG: menaquinone biosynthesis protein [Ginsengibacter sp.]
MKKIKVGAVSYLNTKPLIYGLENGVMKDRLDLIIDYPSSIASMLLKDEIDLGLVPVAIIPQLKEYHIISNYGIGAIQSVASVCLFSDVPLNEITSILLDYQSRTSVALLKILLKERFKISPELVDTREDYRSRIRGTIAGLVIGDRALEQRLKSPFIYDLAENWINLTGLPFLFAAWISNKRLDPNFIKDFNKANSIGLSNLEKVIAEHPFLTYDLHTYYTKNISYNLDAQKKRGLELFLSKLPTASVQ